MLILDLTFSYLVDSDCFRIRPFDDFNSPFIVILATFFKHSFAITIVMGVIVAAIALIVIPVAGAIVGGHVIIVNS